MDPVEFIARYYKKNSKAHKILLIHSQKVADKALATALRVPELEPDLEFIRQAALLHDIGILFTATPQLGCHGNHPYVCHGVLGRTLLEAEGLKRHALVCERHVSVGITRKDIRHQRLPLPDRDMRPVTIEEQIICYADKFFSKNGTGAHKEKTVSEILQKLARYGQEKVERFKQWVDIFES